MIHQQHGVTVPDQIVHDAVQSDDIGRMQSDGRLIQHVQDARRAVPDRPRQLHPLPLPGGKRGRRSVQREVGQAQIHEPGRRLQIGFADVPGHGTHLLGERIRHTYDPFHRFLQRHLTGPVQGDSHQPRRPCGLRKPCPVAFRANFFPEELLHALHALFIFYLIQRVEHRRRGTVIGEVHLPCRGGVRLLWAVEDVLLFHGTVVDDLLFPVGQIPEGDICAHAHGPAYVGHQRPHQAVPRSDGSLVDGEAFIRHQCTAVHRPDCSRSAAAFAGALGVECQLLRAGAVEMLPALRAD